MIHSFSKCSFLKGEDYCKDVQEQSFDSSSIELRSKHDVVTGDGRVRISGDGPANLALSSHRGLRTLGSEQSRQQKPNAKIFQHAVAKSHACRLSPEKGSRADRPILSAHTLLASSDL
jgi:hypothetical protein